MTQVESAKGCSYRKIAVYVFLIFLVLFVVFSIFNLNAEDGADRSFFIIIGGNVLIIGMIGYFFLRNTYTVKLIGSDVEIQRGKKTEKIPLTDIRFITASANFIGALFNSHDFYSIEFSRKISFGQVVHFRCKAQAMLDSKRSFGEVLKAEWLKQKRNSKK